MTLKLQLQLVVKERKVAIIMRIPNPDNEHYVESYCQKHSECVWAKIIEQELSLSVCLPSNNECVMHDAKRGGRRVSVTMTLIFFK